jgi:hypothetical protein
LSIDEDKKKQMEKVPKIGESQPRDEKGVDYTSTIYAKHDGKMTKFYCV